MNVERGIWKKKKKTDFNSMHRRVKQTNETGGFDALSLAEAQSL